MNLKSFKIMLLLISSLFICQGAFANPMKGLDKALKGANAAPWETALTSVADSLNGTTATAVVAIVVAISGMSIMFGIGGSAIQLGSRIGIGAGILFGGGEWLLSMFNTSKGLIF